MKIISGSRKRTVISGDEERAPFSVVHEWIPEDEDRDGLRNVGLY
jgi:hypothetical protein